jgi:membrane associated rhomboid family serine protease
LWMWSKHACKLISIIIPNIEEDWIGFSFCLISSTFLHFGNFTLRQNMVFMTRTTCNYWPSSIAILCQ